MREHRRMSRQIVYIDETWLDSNLTFQKCWHEENSKIGAIVNCSSKNRLIFVHTRTSEGFVQGAELIYKASSQTGDYHGQMNFDNFKKWVLEKLLPNLQTESLVVMDNAPYHTKVGNPTPTKYATKAVMVDWLTLNGIDCDMGMRKAELSSLIENNRPKEVIYSIDKLIKDQGHHVVRLPPYHCDLNAIDYAWATVKRFVRVRNTTGDLSLANLTALLYDAVNGVTADE
nr:uncharacterized protein LOC107443730 [Parasteatoda tepidariorum]